MSETPAIEALQLSKTYDGQPALERIDLRVEAGRILGLLGPNGAGKTTALRCLAGIIPPTTGAVRIVGHDLFNAPLAAKACLCFVPDTPHLFDYLSVTEHMTFMARIHGVVDAEAKIDGLLREFELQDKRHHLPQALSRGMRQKLAICIGFLHSPRVVLLDEPLTGLDPIGIRRMKDSIKNRAAGGGAAVVISSHQLDLIEEICDDILIIKKGRVVIFGSLADIRSRLEGLPERVTLEDIFFKATLDDVPNGAPVATKPGPEAAKPCE